jgi:hypothetical protein
MSYYNLFVPLKEFNINTTDTFLMRVVIFLFASCNSAILHDSCTLQIKDNRRADKITSGPQSHILEGVSWEEAKKLQVRIVVSVTNEWPLSFSS